jgi:hydrogenase/urease accessory protein HupE
VAEFDFVVSFLNLGVEHILGGTDHVLFVLALLLAVDSVKDAFRLTLTFTIAHSLTLLLAGPGLLTLTSAVVEPVIAFSISFVAITTVFFRRNRLVGTSATRIGVVFFFGLFHGLGFAGILRDMRVSDDQLISSLLAFNVGIELGQLAIVTLVLPALYVLRHTEWYGIVLKTSAVGIGLTGVVWGTLRIAGAA